MEKFKIAFGKNHRPQSDELDSYWTQDISALFHEFSDYLMDNYDLRIAVPTWTEKHGWSYRIGRSGINLFSNFHLLGDGFEIDGIKVTDQHSYQQLILQIDEVYQREKDNFELRIQTKNLKQMERNKERLEREQREQELHQMQIVPEKYNKFHWPEKINLTKLRKLYLLDAKGICNEELADDIGLTLFLRCQYGRSDVELMNQYTIRCHHCGEVITRISFIADLRHGTSASCNEFFGWYQTKDRNDNYGVSIISDLFDTLLNNVLYVNGVIRITGNKCKKAIITFVYVVIAFLVCQNRTL